MKKLISIMVVIALTFSTFSYSFAANESDICQCGNNPVIHIPGFGETIYEDPEAEKRMSVFPPETSTITECIPDMIKAVFAVFISGRYDEFGDAAVDILNKMLMPAACNYDGTPLYPETSVRRRELPSDPHNHKSAVEQAYTYSYDEYTFHYDWRLDPFYNAEQLKVFTEHIKELTGHDEVIFTCHSQGSTIISTYLYLYGNEDIEKAIFMCPAFQGISIIGSLYANDYDLENKGEELAQFIESNLSDDFGSAMLNMLVKLLVKSGLVDMLVNHLNNALNSQFDKIMEESLIPSLGTLSGTWAFVPAEYYENAKAYMFGNDKRYAPLIEKIDNYHYNVKTRLPEILAKAQSSGTAIIITAGYGIGNIPLNSTPISNSDFLIDTKYASAGATCASYGDTLGDGYIQAENDCGHNHVSADNIIDASTAALKEYTWFFKGQNHNDFNDGYEEFIDWVITYNGQPDVYCNELYPQFMEYSGEAVVPVK